MTALALAAEARRIPLADAVKKVVACGGPATTGTRADYVKFHDDKVRRRQDSNYNQKSVEECARCRRRHHPAQTTPWNDTGWWTRSPQVMCRADLTDLKFAE